MLQRAWYLLMALLALYLVLNAGWLESAHDRLGGILVLAFGVLLAFLALKPSRAG